MASNLQQDMQATSRRLNQYIGRLQASVDRLRKAETTAAELAVRTNTVVAAHGVINAATLAVQNEVYRVIDELATRCVQFVFGEEYAVAILFEEKRAKSEATIVLTRDGREMDPLHSCGGGVIDVIAFALRLASVLLRADARKVLILDEPFKFVSTAGGMRERAAQLLVDLAEELDFQIIVVTHDEELMIGDTIRIE